MPIDLRGKITKIKTIYFNYPTISSDKIFSILLPLAVGFSHRIFTDVPQTPATESQIKIELYINIP
jgi:hypothetical protein